MPEFQYSHRVTYAECTLGNHVYYARFLDILERARGEFFRKLGTTFLQWQERGFLFPVVECHLSYTSPARYDEALGIEVWVTRAERTRLNLGYRIVGETGTLILEGETFHVCTGLDGKPKRLPPELLPLLEPYVQATQTGASSQNLHKP
jgi:acyl-CoA thioester hydrolase